MHDNKDEKRENSILDELKLVDAEADKDSKRNKRSNHLIARRLMYGAAGLALVTGATVGINHANQDKPKDNDDKDLKDVKQEKHEDPLQHLSKEKAAKVKAADVATKKVVDAVADKKPDAEVKTASDEAMKTINTVADEKSDADTKAIKTAYADVVTVATTPTVDNLQTARTHIANMPDTAVSRDMENKYEDTLIKHVAEKTNKSVKEVRNESKPLTPQQEKAKAESEAKAKKAAAEKAAAEKAVAEKAVAEKAAADKAAADQAANQSANNGGGYTPPANDGGGNYTPPANDGGGYTPPANNGGGASNNQAAQDAANDIYNNGPAPSNPQQPSAPSNSGGSGWAPVDESKNVGKGGIGDAGMDGGW